MNTFELRVVDDNFFQLSSKDMISGDSLNAEKYLIRVDVYALVMLSTWKNSKQKSGLIKDEKLMYLYIYPKRFRLFMNSFFSRETRRNKLRFRYECVELVLYNALFIFRMNLVYAYRFSVKTKCKAQERETYMRIEFESGSKLLRNASK